MIKRLVVLLLLSLPIFGQTNGYQFPATGATGLTVYLSPGSNTITGSVVNWSGGYLTMVRNSTNYAYIDSVTGAPTVNQTGFPTSSIPLFTTTTNYFDVLTVTDSRVTYIGGGGSSGTSVSVNGSNVNTPNFNGTTPAAPANSANITYQVSGSSISGYMGAAGAGLGLTKSGACAGGSFADGTYNADGTPHCTAAAGSGTINAAAQFSVPYYSAAGSASTLSGVANGLTGQYLCATNASAPGYCSPSNAVGNGGASVSLAAANYTIGCDSGTAIVDRGKWIYVGTGGANSVILPDLSGSGCSGMYGGIENATSGNITVARQTADTLTVFGPSSGAPTTAATSFTLAAGQTASFSPDPTSTVYDIRVAQPAAGGGAVSSWSGDGSVYTNSASTGAVTATLGTQAAKSAFVGPRFGANATPSFVASASPLYFSDPTAWVYFFDDFQCNNVNTSSGAIPSCLGWVGNGSGTIANDQTPSGTGTVYGVASCTTGAVSGNQCNMIPFAANGNNNGSLITYNSATGDIYVRFDCPTATVSCFVGVSLNGGGENATSAIGVGYDTTQADTHWMCITRNASTSTRTSLANTPDANFHTARIRFANGTIGCSLDGGTEVTQNTNVPTVQEEPTMSIFTRAASTAKMEVDYYYHAVSASR